MAEVQKPTLTDQVMDYVRSAITSGEIVADAWYSVQQLSEVLGISRTPVRDGLLRLEEAGLIEFTRNRGFQIVATTPADIAEIYALRLSIETPAACRAAQQRSEAELDRARELMELMSRAAEDARTADFFTHEHALHAWVLEVGRSERGARLVEQLRPHTRSLGRGTISPRRPLSEILGEFSLLIGAVIRGDGDTARAAMHTHLSRTAAELLEQAVAAAGEDTDPAQIWQIYAGGV